MKALNATGGYDGEITVFERVEDRVTRRTVRGEFVCYLSKKDVTRELLRALRSSRNVLAVSQEGEDWVRVSWRSGQARDGACHPKDGWFAKQNVKTYEGDVPPLRRWLVDNEVEIQRPRRVYLDIETCGRVPFSRKEESRILCWSLGVEESVLRGRIVAQGVLAADDDKAELQLLRELWVALGNYDQVLAWNGDEFDFPVIFARYKRHGGRIDIRRWLWLDHLVLFRRMNANNSESGEEKQRMSLDAVSQSVLREGKTEGVSYDKLFPWWEAGGELRQRVLDYNARDVELMTRIEQKTGYVELQHTLGEVTGVFSDTPGIQPMPQVESFMFRLGRENGVHFETREREFEEGAEGFRGAFVMDPTRRGIIRDVHVADFSSMYPSIILSWNISPDTIREDTSEDDWLTSLALSGPSYLRQKQTAPVGPAPIPEGYARAPGTGEEFSKQKRGILPLALERLGKLRVHWSQLQASLPPGTPEWVDAGRRSMAYKIAANSFFGVVGARVSRLYEPRVAESISQGGVWLIKKTIEAAQAEPWRFSVIYGDTDSIFVTGCSQARFDDFVRWCNVELYPRLLREQGCGWNTVKIAYEKAFERVVFVSAKRYAGRYSHYKGKVATEESKPEIKGLEYKRGDAVRLGRRLQALVVDLLLGGGVDVPPGLGQEGGKRRREGECGDSPEVFRKLVEEFRRGVLQEELAQEDVSLSKRITKPLKEYVVREKKDGTEGTAPPHVRVARVLEARGLPVTPGTRIEYVILDASTSPSTLIPVGDWTGECDRFDLWESHVWPPTERLLESAFPAESWKAYGKVLRPKRGGASSTQGSLFEGSGAFSVRGESGGALFSLSPSENAPSREKRSPKGSRRS